VADAISLYTAFGFLSLSLPDYASAVQRLRPDITIGPADLPFLKKAPHSKKLIRMVERTEEWMDAFLDKVEGSDEPHTSVFAPVLPVELPIQWDYLRHISEDVAESLSGLAVYDTNMLPEMTSYEPLEALPKLSMDAAKSPRELLRQVSLGMDLCTVPFINNVSDAGIALSFTFPAPEADDILPLGVNMWSMEHQTSLQPLIEGCTCYACQKHHRAFLQHLLNAKEMLGWNLLQAHNHHIISRFFEGIRTTLREGPEAFENACAQFEKVYEPELPVGTGQRPRARGHHFKSEADQKPFNAPAWSNLSGEDLVVESKKQDGVETPLVPTESSAVLAEKGFAETQS
jgi:queuine tRNA-ribosyltransferase